MKSKPINEIESDFKKSKAKLTSIYTKVSASLNQSTKNVEELVLRQKLLKIKYDFDIKILELDFDNDKQKKYLENKFVKEKNAIQAKIDSLENPKYASVPSGHSKSEKPAKTFNLSESLFLLAITILLFLIGSFLILNSNKEPKKTEIEVTIGKIKTKIRTEFETDNFTTYKYPEKTKVENRNGDYYKVELKFADNKEHVQFPTGEYHMETDQSELRKSITNFRKTVYDAIDSNYETELFIKGTADILGDESFEDYFTEPYDEENGFNRIEYLPFNNSTKIHEGQIIEKAIKEPFHNRDLPELRAKYLQKLIIEGNSDWVAPKILEGDVKLYESERERNAYLILFVNWDNPKNVIKQDNTLKYLGLFLFLLGIVFLIYLFFRNRKEKK